MIGGNGLNSPEMYSVAGPAAKGVVVGAAWFTRRQVPGEPAIREALQSEIRKAPDQFAAQAYAGAQIVAYLVTHGATTKDEMLAGLRNAGSIQTVLGPIGFDENRDVTAAPVMLEIVKDGFTYFH